MQRPEQATGGQGAVIQDSATGAVRLGSAPPDRAPAPVVRHWWKAATVLKQHILRTDFHQPAEHALEDGPLATSLTLTPPARPHLSLFPRRPWVSPLRLIRLDKRIV